MPKLVGHNLTFNEFMEKKYRRRAPWPDETTSSWFDQATFSFLNPLLELGAVQGRTLSAHDLYEIPVEESSGLLSKTFKDHFSGETSKPVAPSVPKQTNGELAFDRLCSSLWHLIRPLMIKAGICNFIACSLQVIQPLLVRELVIAASSEDVYEARRLGLRGAAYVAVCVILQGFSQQQQMHLAMRAGQRMRATIVAEVFDTALHLTPAGRMGVSKGEITNLVSIDAQKVFEVTLHAHLLWSSPLQILAVSIMLYQISGPTSLLGIVTLAGVLPLAKMVVKEMLRIRSLRMSVTDERVKIVTEVLEGIRVTKLNGWEPLWAKRLRAIRNKEVGYGMQELFIYGCTMVIMVVSPVIAILAAVSAKMLIDDSARLSAADTFATVALIGALRFPINELGNLLGQSAQAYRAIERISRFLVRERSPSASTRRTLLMNDPTILEDAKFIGEKDKRGGKSFLLDVKNVSYQVGGETVDLNGVKDIQEKETDRAVEKTSPNRQTSKSKYGYCLENISLSVKVNEVVGVVGGVATGKSLLLNGLLGNANQVKGKKPVLANLALYCSQQPFVLNATVKNNILFGLQYDEDRYNKAIYASCLHSDLMILPAGDETEIGERGVTLSGGQKARVGVARCVYAYQPGDICCLDDPLGALDASTAITVFDRLFGSEGAFSTGGVVLVTHAVHLLSRPEVTSILLLDNKNTKDSIEKEDSKTHEKEENVRSGYAAFYGTWKELQALVSSTETSPVETVENEALKSSGYENDLSQKKQKKSKLKALFKSISQHNDFVDNIDAPVERLPGDETSVGEVDSGPKSLGVMSKEDFKKDSFKYNNTQKKNQAGKLTQAEVREEGVASLSTWIRWVKAAGGGVFLTVQLVSLTLDRMSYIACEWWLAKWTSAKDNDVNVFGSKFPAQYKSGSAWEWSKVYFCLGAASIVFCFIRTQWGLRGGIRAANVLYKDASKKLFLAPMSFFDSTPVGRLLHRLSYDTEVVDIMLTQKATAVLVSVGWGVAGVSVMTAISQGIMLAFIIPTFFAVYKVQLFYRRSAVDLQRLDATTRSPLQSLLVEGLEGASTIKAYDVQSHFLQNLRQALDENTAALLCWTTAQRWLGLRLDILSGFISVGASIVIASFRDELGLTPGLAGMMMVWSFNQAITIMFLVNSFTEAEAAATSCERLIALEKDTPQEAPHDDLAHDELQAQLSTSPLLGVPHQNRSFLETCQALCGSCLIPTASSSSLLEAKALHMNYQHAPTVWPSSGKVKFDNVFLRYRKGLDLALNGLSFEVPSGSRCGIVGRTGAGKSTIVSALFRLTDEPLAGGRVLLDDVDLSTLYLRDVRARKPHGMVVIPQDPVLFSGSLRDCLDPFNNFEDHELLEALRAVGINTDRNEELSSRDSSSSIPSKKRKSSSTVPSSAGSDTVSLNLESKAEGGVLEASVHEGGSNWSVGERQLLALARALLEKPKVLILDEATASVDGDTDARIQHMLRNSPHLSNNKVTVLSVAHRLNTVMDFDNILVLDKGLAAEFGKPHVLLQNENGALSKLVDATGPVNARALRVMAEKALPPSVSSSPASPAMSHHSLLPHFGDISLASVEESSSLAANHENRHEVIQYDSEEDDIFLRPFFG